MYTTNTNTTKPKPKFWVGGRPMRCDICDNLIEHRFTDGKTNRGPWAIMCDSCLPKHSIGRTTHHGTGLGQYYEEQADGKWMKIAG